MSHSKLYLRTVGRTVSPLTERHGASWSPRKVSFKIYVHRDSSFTPVSYFVEEESEDEDSDEEEEEEEAAESTPMDGMQTPSGMETPSGMASVVSTVAGGLETPDFLELRKNAGRAQSEAVDSGPRSLYQVVPEKQTSVRGLMGSERGYDVSAVANAGAAIPVLGDERGTKVRNRSSSHSDVAKTYADISLPLFCVVFFCFCSARQMEWTFPSTRRNWRVCRKTNCAAGTISLRVALLAYLVVDVVAKTSRI